MAKKIKVCMPIYSYLWIGGAERQAEKLINSLIQLDCEVDVICAVNHLFDREANSKKCVNIKNLLFGFKGKSKFVKKLYSSLFFLQTIIYLFFTIGKYDVYHCFFLCKYAIATIIIGGIAGKPVIIRNAVTTEDETAKSLLMHKLPSLFYRKASAAVAISEEIKEEFLNIYKIPEEKIHLIHNGIYITEEKDRELCRKNLDLPLDKFIGIISARFSNGKNHMFLFKTWNIVRKTIPDAMLLCLGGGENREQYVEFIKNEKLEENIKLLGRKENITDYLFASDIFVLPSLKEGMSNALLEAMNASLPCVVSDIKANILVIDDEEEGFHFNALGDEDFLAELIIKLYQDKDLRLQLGKNARDKSYNFSIEHNAQKHRELYERLIDKS